MTAVVTGADAARRSAASRELGRRGEDVACRFLQEQGLVVLSRNWRCREGELDVVATDGRRLVVCEVKTRSGLSHDDPVEAVTPEKLARVRRLALRWLGAHGVGWCEIRCDVISLLWPPDGPVRLHHLRNV
jgi:putative endonuclease